MKNSDMPAMPSITELGDMVTTHGGMTKREYFAALAMQGLLANPEREDSGIEDEAEWAVIAADALLDELERTS